MDEDGDRKYKRVHVDWKVGIIQSNNKMVFARIRDVSEGGVYVVSDYGADKGKEFKIVFQIQEQDKFHTIRAKAKIVYVSIGQGDVYGLGMQFSWIEPKGLKVLKQFVRDRVSK